MLRKRNSKKPWNTQRNLQISNKCDQTNLPEKLIININDMNKHFINISTSKNLLNHLDILNMIVMCSYVSMVLEFQSVGKNYIFVLLKAM